MPPGSPARTWGPLVDETCVNVGWRYVYQAIDQHGQVVDVLVSPRRDAAAAAGSSPEPWQW
jgi:transposase-like protein